MYTVKQLSVFLENKPGRVCSAIDELAKNGVNISALTLADTASFGIMRLLLADPERAAAILSESGVVSRISHVLAVVMSDETGSAGDILHLLARAEVNIEYMYVCVGRESGKPIMIIRTDRNEDAVRVLEEAGYAGAEASDLYCD